jgi:hypothetical protein
MKHFVKAATNQFRLKVPKLQPKAVCNSPLKEQEEGARSALYLLVSYTLKYYRQQMLSTLLNKKYILFMFWLLNLLVIH